MSMTMNHNLYATILKCLFNFRMRYIRNFFTNYFIMF